MLKYLNEYVSDFEKDLNIPLMEKSADQPLVEFVKESILSLEILQNIKILGFDYNEVESTINKNDFISKREKKKKKKDRYDLKFIHDDRSSCLTAYIQIILQTIDPKTKQKVIHRKVIPKQFLIPYKDDDGYYHIDGKKYYVIYQLVDKSTYTSSSSVTLKSLMPIAAKRNSYKTENIVKSSTNKGDIHGMEFHLPVYNVYVFKKEIPIILFYLANGLEWAMTYLGVDKVISFVDENDKMDDKDSLYFQISSKCYIKVNTEMFTKYQYIQSIVGGLLHVTTNRITISDLKDRTVWIKKLSTNNTLEKGESIFVFFNRLLDETTHRILMINEHNKSDVYAILRWMMQNYNSLRLKDNLNLENKRLRCNEYIASLLTAEFSKKLNRVISLGSKATIRDFTGMFKFSGEILIQKMHLDKVPYQSNLVWKHNVNCWDVLIALMPL